MPKLVFKIAADYEAVIRLREEISKLEAQLKKMDVNKAPAAARALESQLASAKQQMMGLVTEAARTGAVMENDLKKKLNSASRASDELTEEIIKQKKIIRDTQDDVRRLSEEYSKIGKYSPNSKVKLAELNTAKAALNEQRYSLGELQDQQAKNRLEVRKLTREYKEFASGTSNADEIVKSLTDSLKRTAAEIGGLAAIKKFGSDVIEATGKMQQLQVALSTILQDRSKADQLIAEIVQFAAKTPFNLDDVATGAKQLLAYGSSADNVVNELSMLGDVASGLQIPIGQLIYLYGTLRTQGRAMTVDIRQFAGRGIPIYEELAKVLGVSKDQVGELVKEGKVGFKEVEQAFKNMTSEGGKFANLMENSAGTWPQRLSNIEDTMFQKMNEFGNKYKEAFEFGIGTAEDLVDSLDDVLSVIGGLIAAYGTYKAALIATAVAQKAIGFVESIRLIAMYRKEMGLATAAQQAFNLAAKSNVYITLLSTLVGIGTAVYMFTKKMNEATAAQEALSSVNKKADEEFSKQAATIDRLSGVLKSETSSLDRKKEALSELQAIIPSYNASLDEEGKLINNNTEAIKSYLTQLEKQIRMKAAQEELEESLKNKRDLEKEERKLSDEYWDVRQTNTLQGYNRNGIVAKVSRMFGTEKEDELRKKLEDIRKKIRENNAIILGLNKEIEQKESFPNKDIPQSNISKEINNVTKKIKTLKQEIADLRNGRLQAEDGKTIESAILAKENELQSAQKTLEILTGISQKSETNKVVENQQNISDELFQLHLKNQQDEINLLKEGSEKKRRQIELDYQKEIDAYNKAKAKYGDTDEVKAMKSNAESKRALGLAAITESENQAAIEANERYLKNYGTFMQKREAIIAEYTRKISEANTKGDKDILQREMENALSSINLEKLKQGINWELVFGDLDKVSKDALEKVKQQLNDFKNSEEYKNMAIDQKKVIDEALNNIQTTLIDKGGLLGNLPEQLNELAKAQEELAQAQEEYNEAMRIGTDEQKEAATKKLNNAQKKQQNAQINVQKSTDKTVSNLITLSKTITELGTNSEMSLSQIGNLAGEVVNIFTEAGNNIGGIVGAAFSILDAIGTQGLDGFIGNIFSSVFKSVGGIWDTLTFGGFSKLFGIGGNAKEVQEAINRLTDRNETLQTAIEDLTEVMQDVKGAEAIRVSSEVNKLQKETNENYKKIAQEQARYSGSHHSWNYYWRGFSQEQIDRLSEQIGRDWNGDLWDLSPEEMKILRSNVEMWEQIQNSGKGDYGERLTEKLDDYIEQAGKLDEITNTLYENLTGTTANDVFDDFLNSLYDLASGSEDVFDDIANNWDEMVNKMVINNLIGANFQKKIEGWYEELAELNRKRAENEITDNEYRNQLDKLYNEYLGYVNDSKSDIEAMKDMGIITETESSKEQQSASGKGYATASQDSIDELSGRTTAMYESNLRIEASEQQQTVAITELRGSISALTAQASSMYNIADETRTILANSYLELQQIRENTGEIVKPIKQMQADIAEVKRNTSRL